MQQRFLQVQGHRLAVLCANEHREETPLILLHGIMGAYTFWTHVLPPAIRDGRRWYSFTLPGHFPALLPSTGQTGMAPAELGELLNSALEQVVGDEPAALMGRSTGGYAALVLAATVPERVRGLVTVSGFASGRWRGTLGLMQWLGAQGAAGAAAFHILMRLSVLSPALYKRILSTYATDKAAFRDAAMVDEMVRAVYPYAWRHDAEAMRRLFCQLRDVDIRPMLAQIEAPVLIVGGSEDSVLPVGHQEEMARRIPDAELHLLDGAGHMVFAERTSAYSRIVDRWLQRHIY